MSSSYEIEASSPISAKRMFNAFILEGDKLIPKILPDAVKSTQVIEGDGGIGTIKLITLPQGTLKHRVDVIDEEKLSYTYTIIEGDELADILEGASYNVEILPTGDGGCLMKNRCTYNLKGDASVAEEHINTRKMGAVGLFKAVEAYLIANPTEY